MWLEFYTPPRSYSLGNLIFCLLKVILIPRYFVLNVKKIELDYDVFNLGLPAVIRNFVTNENNEHRYASEEY